MGMTLCPIHGRQFFWEMCEHIPEIFKNGGLPEIKKIPILGTRLCERCYVQNRFQEIENLTFDNIIALPEEEQNQIEEQFTSKYDNLVRKIECVECMKTLIITNSRRNKKSLPFEPFENTLMYKNSDKIEELKNILLANHTFKKLRNPYIISNEAFHMKSGGISYPFSIKFYYITTKRNQDKLLKLIDKFFEYIPQKQRKISFYESENWITEKDENNKYEYRGEEKLLFEQIIK